MSIQELDQQLLRLDQVERIRIAQLLTQSIPSPHPANRDLASILTQGFRTRIDKRKIAVIRCNSLLSGSAVRVGINQSG
jgi:hypothetical protein